MKRPCFTETRRPRVRPKCHHPTRQPSRHLRPGPLQSLRELPRNTAASQVSAFVTSQNVGSVRFLYFLFTFYTNCFLLQGKVFKVKIIYHWQLVLLSITHCKKLLFCVTILYLVFLNYHDFSFNYLTDFNFTNNYMSFCM